MKKRLAVSVITAAMSILLVVPAFANGNGNGGVSNGMNTNSTDGRYNTNSVHTNATNDNDGIDWGWLGLLGLFGLAGLRNKRHDPQR